MAPSRPPRVRDRQRGNSLLIALVVMSALATLGSLTVVSVQSSLKVSTNDRANAIAMYAAESGAAVAMDFLRSRWSQDLSDGWAPSNPAASPWSKYLTPPGAAVATGIPGNDVPPEDPSSLFTKEQNAWFHVQLLNNRDDPGYPLAYDFSDPINDQDGRVIIQSTGYGPQGSVAIIEWEVQRLPTCPPPPASTLPAALCGPTSLPPPPPPPPTPPPPPPPPPSVWINSRPLPATQPLILRSWRIVSL